MTGKNFKGSQGERTVTYKGTSLVQQMFPQQQLLQANPSRMATLKILKDKKISSQEHSIQQSHL